MSPFGIALAEVGRWFCHRVAKTWATILRPSQQYFIWQALERGIHGGVRRRAPHWKHSSRRAKFMAWQAGQAQSPSRHPSYMLGAAAAGTPNGGPSASGHEVGVIGSEATGTRQKPLSDGDSSELDGWVVPMVAPDRFSAAIRNQHWN